MSDDTSQPPQVIQASMITPPPWRAEDGERWFEALDIMHVCGLEAAGAPRIVRLAAHLTYLAQRRPLWAMVPDRPRGAAPLYCNERHTILDTLIRRRSPRVRYHRALLTWVRAMCAELDIPPRVWITTPKPSERETAWANRPHTRYTDHEHWTPVEAVDVHDPEDWVEWWTLCHHPLKAPRALRSDAFNPDIDTNLSLFNALHPNPKEGSK